MKKTNISNSFLTLSAIIGAGFIAMPQIATAQTAPGQSSCDSRWWNCPIQAAPNVSQTLAAPVDANLLIENGVVLNNSGHGQAEITQSLVSGTASAIGNTATAQSADGTPLPFGVYQDITSNVTTHNSITVANPTQLVIGITSVNGNSNQVKALMGGADVQAEQQTGAGTEFKSYSYVETGPHVDVISHNSQSVGNVNAVESLEAHNNNVTNMARQTNNGVVGALAETVACCNNVSSLTNAQATANASNNVSASATSYNWAVQNNTGYVDAVALHTVNSGTGIIVGSQASANNAGAYNKFGYTELNASQTNSGIINSYSALNANYYADTAIVGSAAQANSAIMSSIGSDGRIVADQTTLLGGDTVATTDFTAYSAGGVGVASASSSGNALVGFTCSVCGDVNLHMNADFTQTNGGDNNSTINMNNNGYGRSQAYGVAVGNTASIISQNKKN